MGCCEAKACLASNWEVPGVKQTLSNGFPDVALEAPSKHTDRAYPALMLSLGKKQESLSTAKDEEAPENALKLLTEGAMENAVPNSHYEAADFEHKEDENKDNAEHSQDKAKETKNESEALPVQGEAGTNLHQNAAGPIHEQAESTQPHSDPTPEKVDPADQKQKPWTFDAVAEALRDPAREAKVRAIPDMTKLQIYGLFKQGRVGNVNTKRPGWTDLKGRAKWDAWKSREGMSLEDAQQAYVDFVMGLNVL